MSAHREYDYYCHCWLFSIRFVSDMIDISQVPVSIKHKRLCIQSKNQNQPANPLMPVWYEMLRPGRSSSVISVHQSELGH